MTVTAEIAPVAEIAAKAPAATASTSELRSAS
jgi:hypothetical protein